MATIVSITGKGGTGKTTVAALALLALKRMGVGPLLALDADPDANLGTVLGIRVERTLGDLREQTREAMKNFPPGMSKESYIQAGLHDIIVETDQLDVITMGRSEGTGCYCYINSLLRKFADDLSKAYRWLVMDNEAGLEPISRGLASRIDHLIVVVNANPLSWDCAVRISVLVRELKTSIGRTGFLLNAVAANNADKVRREVAASSGLDYFGAVPHDPVLEERVLARQPLTERDSTAAVQAMEAIVRELRAR